MNAKKLLRVLIIVKVVILAISVLIVAVMLWKNY